MIQAEELNRFRGKLCKISFLDGTKKVIKIKRADSVSLAIDEGIERYEPAIMLSSIKMIRIVKKEEEKKDEKK